MTIETRPDFCLAPHLAQMLSYGCTRLEIGLQARTAAGRAARRAARCWADVQLSWGGSRAQPRFISVSPRCAPSLSTPPPPHPCLPCLHACSPRLRTWRATPTAGTRWRRWASASIWPRTPGSRWAQGRGSRAGWVGGWADHACGCGPSLGCAFGSRPLHARRSTLRHHPPISSTCLPGQVVAHMMPDLPNVGWERDLESFLEFFENPAFRTDGLKVGGGAPAAPQGAGAGGLVWCARAAPAGSQRAPAPSKRTAAPPPPAPPLPRVPAVPHAGHPRYRAVRAVEEGTVPQLPA